MTVNKKTKRKVLRIISVILVIFLFLSVASMAATKIIYDYIFPRYDYTDYTFALSPRYCQIESEYPRTDIYFESGKNTLHGCLYGSGDKGLVVISPGLSRGAEGYIGVVMSFVDFGWRVFTFDPTGCFQSEGDSSVGFAQEILDLDSALDYIEASAELSSLDLFLFGHSRGGYASCCVLSLGHEVKGVVTVSGVNSSMEVTFESSKEYAGNAAYLGYPSLYLYQVMTFGKELTDITATDVINESDCPFMIIQGADDNIAPSDTTSIYAHKEEIYNPNTLFMLSCADHQSGHSDLLYSKEASQYLEDVALQNFVLKQKYPDGIPPEEAEKFYNSIDPMLAIEPNQELMERVNSFLEACKTK
ncbi:MAG: alpha/beta hydrolase [Ruminococcus sp.]